MIATCKKLKQQQEDPKPHQLREYINWKESCVTDWVNNLQKEKEAPNEMQMKFLRTDHCATPTKFSHLKKRSWTEELLLLALYPFQLLPFSNIHTLNAIHFPCKFSSSHKFNICTAYLKIKMKIVLFKRYIKMCKN